jgi:hypothetical protein
MKVLHARFLALRRLLARGLGLARCEAFFFRPWEHLAVRSFAKTQRRMNYECRRSFSWISFKSFAKLYDTSTAFQECRLKARRRTLARHEGNADYLLVSARLPVAGQRGRSRTRTSLRRPELLESKNSSIQTVDHGEPALSRTV